MAHADVTVASASEDGTLLCWDASSLTPLSRHNQATLQRNCLRVVNGCTPDSVMPSAQYLSGVHASKPSFCSWRFAKTSPALYFSAPERLSCLAYCPTGTFAAAGSSSGRLYVWDVTSGALQGVIRAHLRGVSAVEFNSSGDQIVTGGEDGQIHLWFLQEVIGLPYGPGGRAKGGAAGLGLPAASGKASAGSGASSSSSSSSSSSAAAAGRQPAPSPFMGGVGPGAGGMGMGSMGGRASRENRVRPTVTWRHSPLPITALRCAPGDTGGSFRFVAGSKDGAVHRYLSCRRQGPELRVKLPGGETPECLCIDAVSGTALAGCSSGNIAFVDWNGVAAATAHSSHQGAAPGAASSGSDGGAAAAASQETSKGVSLFPAHSGAVHCAASLVGPGRDVAVTGGADGKCLVWDVPRRVCLRVFDRHQAPVTALEVFPANPLAHFTGGAVAGSSAGGASSGASAASAAATSGGSGNKSGARPGATAVLLPPVQLRKQPASSTDSEPIVQGSSDRSIPSYSLPSGNTAALAACEEYNLKVLAEAGAAPVTRAPHVPRTIILDRTRLPDDSLEAVGAMDRELDEKLAGMVSSRAKMMLEAIRATGSADVVESMFYPVHRGGGWVGGGLTAEGGASNAASSGSVAGSLAAAASSASAGAPSSGSAMAAATDGGDDDAEGKSPSKRARVEATESKVQDGSGAVAMEGALGDSYAGYADENGTAEQIAALRQENERWRAVAKQLSARLGIKLPS